jgi:predicted nucleotide-binding protein
MKGGQMRIFIGSSTEAINRGLTKEIAAYVEAEDHEPVIWDEEFAISDLVLPKLYSIASSVDGAILVFGKDAPVTSRGHVQMQPRDNVLIEYGIFSMSLGYKNVVIARDDDSKIPSDLAGLVYLQLNYKKKVSPNFSQTL